MFGWCFRLTVADPDVPAALLFCRKSSQCFSFWSLVLFVLQKFMLMFRTTALKVENLICWVKIMWFSSHRMTDAAKSDFSVFRRLKRPNTDKLTSCLSFQASSHRPVMSAWRADIITVCWHHHGGADSRTDVITWCSCKQSVNITAAWKWKKGAKHTCWWRHDAFKGPESRRKCPLCADSTVFVFSHECRCCCEI